MTRTGDKVWIHGVSVQAESTDADLGLGIRRAGWGTRITQRRGTSNWFHLALPSPEQLIGDKSLHKRVYLIAKINNGAVIKKIHIRESVGDNDCPLIFAEDYNLTGREGSFECKLYSESYIKGPLVLCVKAEFEENDGEIIIVGAGLWSG
jgi:hypothetical protein